MAELEPLWSMMGAQRRLRLTALERSDLPECPGVYALYRAGERIYVGKAKNLRQRAWGAHSSRGHSMRNSAMRRNVAEHLGMAGARAIYDGDYVPTPDEVRRVREWMDGCEMAWLTAESPAAAKSLEAGIKDEFKPPLTKR